MSACGDCGDSMVRKLVPSGGKKYAYYVCGTNKRGEGCAPHNTSEKAAEAAVLMVINVLAECAIDSELATRLGQVLSIDGLSRGLAARLLERIVVSGGGAVEMWLACCKEWL